MLVVPAGMANGAQAQGEVTVGGLVEVIGGSSDHNEGVDGLDRGYFSRIVVDYDKTLDNGLQVSGDISYLLNQRYAFAPDVLSLSVGGGFGTVTAGAAAAAACATMPRVIAMVPGGVNATWYKLFSALGGDLPGNNGTFSEANYCGTSESISYQTPTMGGLQAMATYAPNMGSNQATHLRTAQGAPEDYFAVAGKFSTDMGAMSLDLGASFQTAKDDRVDSVSVAGIVSVGGASVGVSWYDNGDASLMDLENPLLDDGLGTNNLSGTEGFNVGANYTLGPIKPGVTYSSMDFKLAGSGSSLAAEATALAVGASYAVGGGLSVFAEYMRVEGEYNYMVDDTSDFSEEDLEDLVGSADETILMAGAIISF